jgi:hypothetical protein
MASVTLSVVRLYSISNKSRSNQKGILRVFVALLLCLSLATPPQSHADVISDSDKLLSQLNPITGALDGLIGDAADKGNAVLQQQLEHLRAIIKEAIFDLDQVVKKRGEQLDEAVVKDIALLNQYVQQNLVQFDALVGKRLGQLDQSMYDRINQFNFGLANVLASIKFINTISLIQTDKAGNGISAFKQVGDSTRLYIIGSGFTKHGTPSAYLSGGPLKSDLSSGYGLWGKGTSVSVTASMGLLEVTIPNKYLPDSYGPADMSLELKIPSGWVGSDDQSVPLHICGSVPRLFATIKVQARGKHYVRTAVALRDLHAACRDGNNNNSDYVCPPDVAPEGWEFDGSTNSGNIISYGGENHNGYRSIVWNLPANRCLKAYCDGTEGNAHQNIQGIQYHLIKLDDLDPCVPAITVPAASDDASKVVPLELKYYDLTQFDLTAAINTAKGGECAVAAPKAPPSATEAVELMDSSKKHLEFVSLIPGATVDAQTVDVEFALGLDGKLNMKANPKCEYHPMPRTQ